MEVKIYKLEFEEYSSSRREVTLTGRWRLVRDNGEYWTMYVEREWTFLFWTFHEWIHEYDIVVREIYENEIIYSDSDPDVGELRDDIYARDFRSGPKCIGCPSYGQEYDHR